MIHEVKHDGYRTVAGDGGLPEGRPHRLGRNLVQDVLGLQLHIEPGVLVDLITSERGDALSEIPSAAGNELDHGQEPRRGRGVAGDLLA
jgi:hypothetical protein